jgi:formylglycine-generating enzyme required for sulfatase activity
VIIGPDWANLAYPNGEKRLFDLKDVTRWEVETGLERIEKGRITLIPVLIMNAQVPRTDELPASLKPLIDRNVIRIRNYPDFDNDIGTLIHDIRLSQDEDDMSIEYFEPITIRIEKGKFWMGSPEGVEIPGYENPQHEVFLPAYRMGKYPVTNAQYEEFISQTNRPVSSAMGWEGQKVSAAKRNHPVTGVNFFDALVYCIWLSNVTKRKYTIPNEAQWEKACRGGNKFTYPWGNEFQTGRCNYNNPVLAPVDAYPAQNENGFFDFVGNIRQWTCSLWGEKRITPDSRFAYPWKDDQRNDLNASRQIRRVVRGSSVKDELILLRCSARSGQVPDDPGLPGARHGFRVVLND